MLAGRTLADHMTELEVAAAANGDVVAGGSVNCGPCPEDVSPQLEGVNVLPWPQSCLVEKPVVPKRVVPEPVDSLAMGKLGRPPPEIGAFEVLFCLLQIS